MIDQSTNKIFVNIASYRDPLLSYTIESIVKNAKYPENITLGICWQRGDEEVDKLPSFGVNMKVIKVPAKESKGACWARSLAFELRTDEKFFWLIDSHMSVIKNWDEILIDQFYQTNDSKALLSCAASQWNPPDGNNEWAGDSSKRAVPRATEFYGSLLLQMFDVRDNIEQPELNSFLTACNLFGPSKWIRDVPYDPDMFFLGEEITLAVRSFTHGYNHYATRQNMAYHKHDRAYRKVYSDDNYREMGHLQNISIKRVESLLMQTNEIPMGIYGIGSERTIEQYEKYAGINFKTKEVSDRARTGRPDISYL